MVPRRLLYASLRSSWSPASAFCQMSSTVSSASSPQHFWEPCIFRRRTNIWISLPGHLRDPAVDPEQFRRDLKICSPDIRRLSVLEVLRNRAVQIDIYLLTYLTSMMSLRDVAMSLHLVDGFHWNLAQVIIMRVTVADCIAIFSRSEVIGKGHSEVKKMLGVTRYIP